MLEALAAWAERLGGPGLALIALLDSSFLSFPQVNDVLMVVLSARQPDRMLWYATTTTLGSVLGCLLLHLVAGRGGAGVLQRGFSEATLTRVRHMTQRYGMAGVIVPAMLPPPTPFKLCVVMAGLAGMPASRLALSVALGRGLRYVVTGWLAVRYGERAWAVLQEHATAVGVVVLLSVPLGLALWVLMRRRPDPTDEGVR
jgi:membrane protein YqaA with SNARE-associated domain